MILLTKRVPPEWCYLRGKLDKSEQAEAIYIRSVGDHGRTHIAVTAWHPMADAMARIYRLMSKP